MSHRFHLLKCGAALLAFAAATLTPVAGSAATQVFVADVEQLYAAVNSGANVGASVILAPGIYRLSSTDPAGVPRPNGGRLDLQEDMSLYGVDGDRAAVVIDATALPQPSFTGGLQFTGRTGVIRTGRGSNAVEWLTIAGNPFAAAGVETDLFLTPAAEVRIAHVVAGNSARGVDIRNAGAGMIGRRLDAEIEDSEFFGSVEGIRVANFVGAHDGDIRVVMNGNRVYDNTLGCIIENNRSTGATIYVRSSGDRFEHNGLGCQIGAALVGSPGVADFNSTLFEGHGTEFSNNTKRSDFCDACMGPDFDDFGGLLVVGGDVVSTGLPNSTSNNTLAVRLWGCKVAGNQSGPTDPTIDFLAFGARLTALSGIAGTDNHATIELHGVSARLDVVDDDSLPDDPSGSNTVTVIRSPAAP